MIYIEILEQDINQNKEEFCDYIQTRINEITNYNPSNIINIQWLNDVESFYPLSCIITYFKELS